MSQIYMTGTKSDFLLTVSSANLAFAESKISELGPSCRSDKRVFSIKHQLLVSYDCSAGVVRARQVEIGSYCRFKLAVGAEDSSQYEQ